MAATPSSAGNRFRQRKISTKQTLQIFKQSQLSDVDNEDLQQRDIQEIETGVEKNEEEEVHLQQILKSSGLANSANAYIPTPDASKKWPEAAKYYTGKFVEPDSYIKSSCQVEDYVGCLYNLDEEDDQFLQKLNSEQKQPPLTEDELEVILFNFEKVIAENQPFLITDPTQVLPLGEIKLALLKVDRSSVENINKTLAQELNVHPFVTQFDAQASSSKAQRPLDQLINLYGEETYEHFKERKIARLGKPITPVLKFTGEDDTDAYICFRQRQFRQQRKTRRADTQSSDKLIRLYQELKATKDLTFLVAQRELKRLEAIQTEHEIFELRCQVKSLKRNLGVTDSDDDLIAHKKKKIIPPDVKVEDKKDKKGLSKSSNNANIQDRNKQQVQQAQAQVNGSDNLSGTDGHQQFQPYVKLPPSKIPDMELETVQHLLKNKDITMQKFVEEKLKKRKQLDIGFTNLTDDPNNPLFEINIQNQKIMDKKHIPYSSITSSFFDVQSPGYIPNIDKYLNKGASSKDQTAFMFDPKSGNVSKKHVPERYNPLLQDSVNTSDPVFTLRKRVGRLGQIYIDSKPIVGKFNQDDEVHDDQDIEMIDSRERFEDRWKFDSSDNSNDSLNDPFSDDPAKLNSISNETQVIRFGSMLLSKAYETLKESILHQRQQVYYQQLQRIQAQQPSSSPSQTLGQQVGHGSVNKLNKQTPPQPASSSTNSAQKGQSSRASVPPASNVVNSSHPITAIKSEN